MVRATLTDLASRAFEPPPPWPAVPRQGGSLVPVHNRNRQHREISGEARHLTLSLGNSFQHNSVGSGPKKPYDQSHAHHCRRHEEKHGEHTLRQQQSNDEG